MADPPVSKTISHSPRSLRDRTRREDRHLKFYELRDNLVDRLKAVKGATIWCTPTNGTVTARISPAGDLTWKASGQLKVPWWSGRDEIQHGNCNEL